MAININREVEDTFYRYKMPKLQAKVEGKGNGIKTVIVNVSEIAKALYRKPMYVTKYFGCELGAQVNVDEKNDRYIVNGAHEADKLQQLLDGFIKKFVLCPSCGNPETDLTVKKKAEIVKSTCKACGASKTLDARHRLTQYIIKNPPVDEEAPKTKRRTTNKKEEDDSSPNGAAAGDEDEDWGEETTEDAQRQRMEELSSMAKALALSADVEKSKKERTQMFFNTLSELFMRGDLAQQVARVLDEADRLELGARAVLVLVEVVLNEPELVNDHLKRFGLLFRRLVEASDSPHKAQLNMLNAVVTLVEAHPHLLKKAPVYVKTMYDLDIAKEEVILEWADKTASSKYGAKKTHEQVLEKCQVLFQWLREAEEESSDEDEEHEEAEDDENRNPLPTKSGQVLTKTAATAEAGASADDEDDLDIDAI